MSFIKCFDLIVSVMKISIFGSSSIGLLSRLVAAHILGTLFAYLVYIRFTTLGDGYLPEAFAEYLANDNDSFSSTLVTFSVYYYLGQIFPSFLAPLIIGVIIAFATWITFRDIYIYIGQSCFGHVIYFPIF